MIGRIGSAVEGASIIARICRLPSRKVRDNFQTFFVIQALVILRPCEVLRGARGMQRRELGESNNEKRVHKTGSFCVFPLARAAFSTK
jgi:hypothetical protein